MKLPIIPPWVTHVAFLVIGIGIGGVFWYPRQTPVEPAAPVIALPGGDQVIARNPVVPVPEPVKQAVKHVPGAKVTRAISFDIKPKPLTATLKDCPPLHVDLGVVKMADDTQRVIATSPDGEIKNAIDIPVGPTIVSKSTKWSVGVVYDVLNNKYGVYGDRYFGPLVVGAEIIRTPDVRSYTAVGKLGFRF